MVILNTELCIFRLYYPGAYFDIHIFMDFHLQFCRFMILDSQIFKLEVFIILDVFVRRWIDGSLKRKKEKF